jgi:hypothetical protein
VTTLAFDAVVLKVRHEGLQLICKAGEMAIVDVTDSNKMKDKLVVAEGQHIHLQVVGLAHGDTPLQPR